MLGMVCNQFKSQDVFFSSGMVAVLGLGGGIHSLSALVFTIFVQFKEGLSSYNHIVSHES